MCHNGNFLSYLTIKETIPGIIKNMRSLVTRGAKSKVTLRPRISIVKFDKNAASTQRKIEMTVDVKLFLLSQGAKSHPAHAC